MRALLMLAVFTANLYAVCHCHHAVMPHAASHSACCASNTRPGGTNDAAPCSGKDGCSGRHAVQFGLSDKQAAEKIAVDPLAAQLFIHTAISPERFLTILPRPMAFMPEEWLHKHPPPDLQALYKSFQI